MNGSHEEFDPAPQTDDERHGAALAVYEVRKAAEGHALVEELSDREKLLIEQAWAEGADAAREALTKALASPHAVTLDAKSVTGAIAKWRDDPHIFSFVGWWGDLPGQRHDKRVVALVRRALREAEARREAT